MEKQTLKQMGIQHSPRQSNDGFMTKSDMICPKPETILENQLLRNYLLNYQMGLIQYYNSNEAKNLSALKKGSIQAEITEVEIRVKSINKIINL